MIEVHLAYDVKPGIDEQVYFEWLKKEIVKLLKTQKIIEICAHRKTKGSPEVLVVALWNKLEDWIEFSQTETWHFLHTTLQQSFAENMRIEIWEPSPFLPTPLRPPKKD